MMPFDLKQKEIIFLFFIGIVFGIYLAIAVLSYYTTAEVLRDPPSQGIYKTYSFTHDDLTRTYDVYIPSSLKNEDVKTSLLPPSLDLGIKSLI